MQFNLIWKWGGFSEALHFEEVTKFKASEPYRIYVFFTDKDAAREVYNIEGIESNIGVKNILYVGKVNYERGAKLKDYPLRIGERILSQGHKNLFTLFEFEPGPIYLGVVGINDPYYQKNLYINHVEGYLIRRLGPRYNKNPGSPYILKNHIPITSSIHENCSKEKFTGFMEFNDNIPE